MNKLKLARLKHVVLILSLAVIMACSDKFDRIPEDQFIGTWKLTGRSIFNGITIEIDRNENGKLTGRIKELNNNKYVKMFAEVGDLWISDISRRSNFQFRITEEKIARELFSLYGLSTSAEFKAEFINDDIIGISSSSDPAQSKVMYKRID